MKVREFKSELWLPLPPEELFPFFADAANLHSITPPWLHFHIISPPLVVMQEGALIDYRLRVCGLPLRWRTRINNWQPPHRFVDDQLSGPYRQWIHSHTSPTPRRVEVLSRDKNGSEIASRCWL